MKTLETETKKSCLSRKTSCSHWCTRSANSLSKSTLLQYEQILLTKNFRQYLETKIISSKELAMGIKKMPYQKTYEMQIGLQEFMVDFKG